MAPGAAAGVNAPPAPADTNDVSAWASGPVSGARRRVCCASDSLARATVKVSSPPPGQGLTLVHFSAQTTIYTPNTP
jgi:hypothetical protein